MKWRPPTCPNSPACGTPSTCPGGSVSGRSGAVSGCAPEENTWKRHSFGLKSFPLGNDPAGRARSGPPAPLSAPSRAEPLAPPLPRFSSSDWWIWKRRSSASNQRPASVAKRPLPGRAGRPGEATAAAAVMAGGWRDVAGVRIVPAELCFRDAVPGRRYRAPLSVQNRRVESCRLQLLPPRRPQVRGWREGSGGECLPPPAQPRPGWWWVPSSRPAYLYRAAVGSLVFCTAPRTTPACVSNGSAS